MGAREGATGAETSPQASGANVNGDRSGSKHPPASPAVPGWRWALFFVVCATGTCASYLVQGLLQEKLSVKKYGAGASRLDSLYFVNFAQCVVCLLWSGGWEALVTLLGRPPNAKSAPVAAFWGLAVTNTVGPALGIRALKNITYPAQVLAKSSKMIPVMLVGAALFGRAYSAAEYACAAAIAGGISLYALADPSGRHRGRLASPDPVLGYGLCLVNLAMDGFTNGKQDSLKEKYPATTPNQLMAWTNAWCVAYYALYLFGLTGDGHSAVAFLAANPEAAWDLGALCLCGAFGQSFIFLTIGHFGSLANVLVTTTRKFFAILLSAAWHRHDLSPAQWLAVGLVFAGLGASIALDGRKRRARHAAAAGKRE